MVQKHPPFFWEFSCNLSESSMFRIGNELSSFSEQINNDENKFESFELLEFNDNRIKC